jgi:hypothetical protein
MFQNTGKGALSFETVEKILETQAFFPNLSLQNVVYLWMQARDKGFMPDTVARWNTFKNKGYTIELGNEALKLREWSPHIKKYLDRSFFDISQTDMPMSESRRSKIRKLRIDEKFTGGIYNSFTKATGYSLEQSTSGEISIDYEQKKIFFPLSNSPQTTLTSFIKAAATLSVAPTQDIYNATLTSEAKRYDAKMQATLISNALYSLIGQQPIPIGNNAKKEYFWGEDLIARIKKIEELANETQKLALNMEIEKHFNIAISQQETKAKEEYISNNKSSGAFSDKNEALKEETNRLKEEILRRGDILSLAEEYAGSQQLKKNGNEYKINCLLPTHDEKTPSMSINPQKNMYKCFGCGGKGDIITLAMEVEGLSFPEAVDALAQRFGIHSRKEDILAQFNKPKTMEELKKHFLEKHPNEDKTQIMAMKPKEFKSYQYDIETSPSREKVYRPIDKTQNNSTPIQSQEPKTTRITYKKEVNDSVECVNYLAQERGIVKYPKELKHLVGEKRGVNDDGKEYIVTYSGIGFINESNGADIRLPKTFSKEEQYKKTRSVGDKDIVILNKENIDKTDLFIVSESGWDYTAAFNQAKFNEISQKAVVIIANGTGEVDKAINFINNHKTKDTKIIVLTQADESNLKFTRDLLLGTKVTNYARVEYSTEEHNKKMDINDLHLEGIDICSRFYGTFDPVSVTSRKQNTEKSNELI